MLLIYYSVLSLTFVFGSAYLTDYSETIELDDSGLQEEETGTGGIFSIGISVARFFGFVGFGLGLPDSTPTWFQLVFSAWQTILTIFTIGFIISSIWDG